MKVSVCVTVLNEEETISDLIYSLLNQTKMPDEIVVVDGGSNDKTVEVVRHFQKKDKRLIVLTERCSRAKGRNLAVEIAHNDVVAMTDAGCVANKDWLKNISSPLENKEIEMVAGFYKMTVITPFQKALSVYLGVLPSKFDINFLPSARSLAFKKILWEKIGGFPESQNDTAEDTLFNFRAIRLNARISRVKDALVEWRIPLNLKEAFNKFYIYSRGDAKSKIFWNDVKGVTSHNICALLILLRYFLGLILLYYSYNDPLLAYLLTILIVSYIFWAFRKTYKEYRNIRVGLWGIMLQFVSDIAVSFGFIKGLLDNSK